MKVCFAYLLDHRLHNYARKLAFELNKNYDIGVMAARLPQHVTLGPVFEVDDPSDVEEYFGRLAKSIEPFELDFSRLELKLMGEGADSLGILWMELRNDAVLRSIHDRVYAELSKYGWKVAAMPGGEEYHFHSTIALGGQSAGVYKKLYNEIQDKEINLKCTVRQITLSCPPDGQNAPGTYITYRILPMGKLSEGQEGYLSE